MAMLTDAAAHVLAHPGEFLVRVLKGFAANQGLLLLGAQVISGYERIERSGGAARFAGGRAQSPTTTPSRRGSAPPK